MRKDIRMSQSIQQIEDKVARGQNGRKDGQWKEIVPTLPKGAGGQTASPRRSRAAVKALENFYYDLSSFFIESRPASILPCILDLPEKIDDWPDSDTFYKILLNLLSDNGFLFAEKDFTASGQYPIPDLFAALAPHGGIRDEISLEETKLISNIQREFWKAYATPADPQNELPQWLKWLERIAEPYRPNLFRCCIIEMMEGELADSDGTDFESNTLILLCQRKWAIPDKDLDTCIDKNGEILKRCSDSSGGCSLRTALTDLSEICGEQLRRYDEVLRLLGTFKDLSRESCDCYRKVYKTYQELDQAFQVIPLLICSSNKLPRYIENSMIEWYRHVDVIKAAETEKKEHEDVRVRFNGRARKDTERALPIYFSWKWIMDDMANVNYEDIKKSLCLLFFKYGNCFEKQPPSDEQLDTAVNKILALSFSNIFDIGMNTEGIDETPVTIAPTIIYIVYRWYYTSKATFNMLLERIPMKLLTSTMKIPKEIKKIENDLWLYRKLCRVYAQYYGMKYSQNVQAIWDASFLTYSGYRELFIDPSLLYELKVLCPKIQLPCSVFGERIQACLLSNRASLVHSSVIRNNWMNSFDVFDSFYPQGPSDLGWNAVTYFRKQLVKFETKGKDKPLEQFREFIREYHSHNEKECFIQKQLKSLIGLEDHRKAKNRKEASAIIQRNAEKMDLLCAELHLDEAFCSGESATPLQKGHSKLKLMIALEYTMRLMLEEQCSRRLYNWLYELIDIKCDELIREEW